MTWRIVAVDDEPPALLALEHAFSDIADFTLVGTTTDSREAPSLIERWDPDAVFLDIHMPGLTGFDIVRQLGERMPPVVFLTAFDQHALAAFATHAIDYLLKPLDRAQLGTTLDHLRERLAERRSAAHASAVAAQMRALLMALDDTASTLGASAGATPTAAPRRVAVRWKGRTVLLEPLTIDRVEVTDNDLRIVVGREVLVVRDTLSNFQRQLPDSHFVRVHRSVVVNIARVRAFEPHGQSEYMLHMADGARVMTGRTFRERVRTALGMSDM